MHKKYEQLETYIEEYWEKLRVKETLETKTHLGLPHPYYAPSTEQVEGFSFPHMFYWDSYFIAQGLWGTDREGDIVMMAENMFDLIRRFGFVPNSNSFAHLSRSQPPLLSTLVRQIYNRIKTEDKGWLELAYSRVEEEYQTVWISRQHPHNRLVYKGLSRYYDANVLHVLAEAESGWDYTTRFDDRCLDFLAIDLNSYLYKYEVDMAYFAEVLGREREANHWSKAAALRRESINKLMWSDDEGMFFDYDYKSRKQSPIKSLAAYTTLFSGLASKEQAERMVDNLIWFETAHGLTATSKGDLVTNDKQWSSPNGWAPLHDIVIDGLDNYGFTVHADRISGKWVKMVNNNYERTKSFDEKYNVVDPNLEAKGSVYPMQYGFGWTNGVTAKLIRRLNKQ